MKDEIKEILDKFEFIKKESDKLSYYPEDLLSREEMWLLYDYITNLQKESKKKDNVINGIEEFIEYLDRETNVYLVNTAYTVILGKLKKLKIDNGLLQGSDNNE